MTIRELENIKALANDISYIQAARPDILQDLIKRLIDLIDDILKYETKQIS